MSSIVPSRSHAGGHAPHIVIPYNYADHEFAARLTVALRQDHFTPWIDDVDMSAGVLLVHRIMMAVRPVDLVIPAISSASLPLSWVQHELKTITTRAFQGRHVRVVSARVDACALPDFLLSMPYVDFHRLSWDTAYDDLVIALQQRAGMAPARPDDTSFRLPKPASLT